MDAELLRMRQAVQTRDKFITQMQRELDVARMFLSLEDSQPDKVLMDIVRNINYDVSQFAWMIGETLVTMGAACTPAHTDCAICAVFAYKFPGMLPALRISEPRLSDAKDLLCTYAMQSQLLAVCYDSMSLWNVSTGNMSVDKEVKAFLQALNREISDKEPQAISGNWTAITYRNAARIKGFSAAMDQEDFVERLSAALQPIWHIYGLTNEQGASIVRSVDLHRLGETLRAEVQAFKRGVAQAIVSADIEPVMVPPNVAIDRVVMQFVEDTAGSTPSDAVVICTSGLGLRRTAHLDSGDVQIENLVLAEVITDHRVSEVCVF